MPETTSPMLTERVASVLGIDRRSVEQSLTDVRDAIGDRGTEISRRIQAIYAGSGSAEVKFESVVTYTEASVLNDNSIKTRLMISLGGMLVGGLLMTLGTTLPFIIGAMLILLFAWMALEPARQGLDQLKEKFAEI